MREIAVRFKPSDFNLQEVFEQALHQLPIEDNIFLDSLVLLETAFQITFISNDEESRFLTLNQKSDFYSIFRKKTVSSKTQPYHLYILLLHISINTILSQHVPLCIFFFFVFRTLSVRERYFIQIFQLTGVQLGLIDITTVHGHHPSILNQISMDRTN